MNIVEKEATYFSSELFEKIYECNIDYLKRIIKSKLYNFDRDKDKLFFLSVLRKTVEFDKIEHEKTCTTEDKNDSQVNVVRGLCTAPRCPIPSKTSVCKHYF